jgi:hypothetical protein
MAKKEPSEPIIPLDDSDISEKQDTAGGEEYGALALIMAYRRKVA